MTDMKLIDLNPRFVGAGGAGVQNKEGNPSPVREGIGMSFDCPCGCDIRTFLLFTNPIDGGQKFGDRQTSWERTGDSFESMTLRPSILRTCACG